MKKNQRVLNIFLRCGSFVFYMIVLLAILFRATHSARTVNLIPFHTISNFLSRERILHIFTISNVFGNIILFVPLGMYLNLFRPGKKVYQYILSVFFISLLVEIVQYTFKMGIGDIDDVILNTFGGAIGIFIDRILLLKLKNENKARNIAEIIGAVLSILILVLYKSI